jgi:hypothetical protein
LGRALRAPPELRGRMLVALAHDERRPGLPIRVNRANTPVVANEPGAASLRKETRITLGSPGVS